MLLTEYDEKKTIRLFKKEAREEGFREGRELGRQEGQNQLINTMLQNGITAEKISEMTGASLQQIQEARSSK